MTSLESLLKAVEERRKSSGVQNVPDQSTPSSRKKDKKKVEASPNNINSRHPNGNAESNLVGEGTKVGIRNAGENITSPNEGKTAAVEAKNIPTPKDSKNGLIPKDSKNGSTSKVSKKVPKKAKFLLPEFPSDESDQEADTPIAIGDGEGIKQLPEVKPWQRAKITTGVPRWMLSPRGIPNNLSETTLLDDAPYLSDPIRSILRGSGYNHLFPVQAAVIPEVVKQNISLTFRSAFPRDICVSAPTGSGKTLSFALPVIQLLSECVTRRTLRALVVLPVKDLAVQVYQVFENLIANSVDKATALSVGIAVANKPFDLEQKALVDSVTGLWKVDILVCTPGRLVDHLDNTAGFNLSKLIFLVMDEGDRLLQEVKQCWLPLVERAVETHSATAGVPRPPASPALPLRKLLLSATLSQDPEKLHRLHLHNPLLFAVASQSSETTSYTIDGAKFVFPQELTHEYVTVEANHKPLVILHLLLVKGLTRVICFTKSAENTRRLYRLIGFCDPTLRVAQFSTQLKGAKARKTATRFNKGLIDIIVCTDALARGLDLESVSCSLLYDAPRHMKTYVHRVGRSARAGRNGSALTICEEGESRDLINMVRKEANCVPTPYPFKLDEMNPFLERYREALRLTAEHFDEAARSKTSKQRRAREAPRGANKSLPVPNKDSSLTVAKHSIPVEVNAVNVDDAVESSGKNKKKRKHDKTNDDSFSTNGAIILHDGASELYANASGKITPNYSSTFVLPVGEDIEKKKKKRKDSIRDQ